MDEVKVELKKLKDKGYIEERGRNLDFAKEFLAKVVEDPNLLDSIPEGALLVPYLSPQSIKKGKKKLGYDLDGG